MICLFVYPQEEEFHASPFKYHFRTFHKRPWKAWYWATVYPADKKL